VLNYANEAGLEKTEPIFGKVREEKARKSTSSSFFFRMFSEAFGDSGKKLEIHGIRKSVCTHLLAYGFSAMEVANFIGHASQKVTIKHYLKREMMQEFHKRLGSYTPDEVENNFWLFNENYVGNLEIPETAETLEEELETFDKKKKKEEPSAPEEKRSSKRLATRKRDNKLQEKEKASRG
jgi:hypothetical protein